MRHKCGICGNGPTLFFIWSSSRNVLLDKITIKCNIEDKERLREMEFGVPICFRCYNKIIK